jgi:16S rRNA (guanine527-N7)-methyltransferase
MSAIYQQLQDGFVKLGLAQDATVFEDYLNLLDTWNRAYNLTAIQDPSERVSRHILDSLAILPWVQGSCILDVGTGAGLPGVPLALARPDLRITLLDSNGKKTRFLHEVKRALSLANVDIIHSRVEQYSPASGFDTIVSRAFSELDQMMQWTKHLIAEHGIWLAMKGRRPDAELAVVPTPAEIHAYTVPGVEGERCCVVMKKT